MKHSSNIHFIDTPKSPNPMLNINESFMFKNAIIFHLFSFKEEISKCMKVFKRKNNIGKI